MKAFGVNVLVKPINREKTEGGIIIPDIGQDGADVLQKAEVLSVGDGTYLGGKVEMKVKEGDTVYYRGLKGIKVTSEEKDTRKIINIADVILYETN